MNDFTSFSTNLRQLLDWAFFVEKHTKVIDWKWLTGVLEQYHMLDFYSTINAICVDDLGFEASIFHGVQFKPMLKDKVLKDILEPEFTMAEPSRLIPRLAYKIKRWRGNRWKHEMCYNESMWSAFLERCMESCVKTSIDMKFLDNETRLCSMDFGCITPLYAHRMCGVCASLEDIAQGLTELREQDL